MQNSAKHSSPRKASSGKAQPSPAPIIVPVPPPSNAKPLPSNSPLISFAVKGVGQRATSGQGPPRPPAGVFAPQPRSPVVEMASLPAKPPPPSQAIHFPRKDGPKDVLQTHTMSVRGASSSSMPLSDTKAVKMESEESASMPVSDTKAVRMELEDVKKDQGYQQSHKKVEDVKMELEESEEGEVAEESAVVPAASWGDSREMPAASESSSSLVFLTLQTDSIRLQYQRPRPLNRLKPRSPMIRNQVGNARDHGVRDGALPLHRANQRRTRLRVPSHKTSRSRLLVRRRTKTPLP
jgi:hypothetical protein